MPPTDFAAVHARHREILEPYRSRLVATKDGPDGLMALATAVAAGRAGVDADVVRRLNGMIAAAAESFPPGSDE